jgi:hypothetical protein
MSERPEGHDGRLTAKELLEAAIRSRRSKEREMAAPTPAPDLREQMRAALYNAYTAPSDEEFDTDEEAWQTTVDRLTSAALAVFAEQWRPIDLHVPEYGIVESEFYQHFTRPFAAPQPQPPPLNTHDATIAALRQEVVEQAALLDKLVGMASAAINPANQVIADPLLRLEAYGRTLADISDGWKYWGIAGRISSQWATKYAEARASERERCARRAENEEEPAIGEMPPEMIARVLAGDTVYVESALIAAVRATKKCIAATIRALRDPGE